jgi:uncharacterized protein involved in exopolysaccharide biosynthesis
MSSDVPAEVPSEVATTSSEQANQDPEVRLELTNAGVRQVWALYSQEHQNETVDSPRETLGEDDALSIFLRDLPGIAWRGRWYLAGCLALTLLLGTVYLMGATSIYNVSAQILVEQRASVFDSDSRVRGGGNFLATQAEIIHSPPIVRRALNGIPALSEPPEGFVDDPNAPPFDPSRKILKSLVATPIVGTDVLAISYRSSRPGLGVEFVESLIATYRDYVVDLEQGPHRDALALLSRKEEELSLQLAELENEYQELRAGSESMGEGENALQVQKSVLERQAQMLVEARSRRVDLENQLNAMKWSQSNGSSGVGSNSPIQQELWRAEVRFAELTQQYSEKHPEVRAVKHQMETLRKQLRSSSTAALESRLRAARGTEKRLSALYNGELEKAKTLDSHHLEEEEIRAAISSLEGVHQAALSKLKDMELVVEARQEGGAGILIRVLEAPVSGYDPIWPRPELVLLPCALVGIMGGLALAVVTDRFRGSLSEQLLPARPDPMGKQSFEPVG